MIIPFEKYRTADPKQYIEFRNPWQDRIHPVLAGRLAYMALDMRKKVVCTSGFRSDEEQIKSQKDALAKHPDYYQTADGRVYNSKGQCMVAAVGQSNHNWGLAIDSSGTWIEKLTNEQLMPYGLCKPMSYEPWHVECVERLSLDQKKQEFYEYMKEYYPMDVKTFQMITGLKPDNIVGPLTNAKAIEVKKICEEIISAYAAKQKPSLPQYTTRVENGTRIIEINPMTLRHVYLKGTAKKPAAELAGTYKNFINCMFYSGENILRLFIQDEKVVNGYPADDTRSRGTLIIYTDGRVDVKTVRDISPKGIRLAVQGFNLDYEANGSKNLVESMQKEGWGADNNYIHNYTGMRGAIGYNYKTGKIVVVKKSTNAAGIRTELRKYGCVDKNGNTVGIGLDSGASDATVLGGKVINATTRSQVSILTFE